MGWRTFAYPALIAAIVLTADAPAASGDPAPPAGIPNVDPDLKAGYAALESGEVDRAILDFDAVIGRSPANVMAVFYRGLANFAKGADDAALADLKEAAGLDPTFTTAMTEYGLVRDLVRKDAAPEPVFNAPAGDAPSKAVGRTHECIGYFLAFSVLMVNPGEVLVGFDVTETGQITNVSVQTSSGDLWMDRAATLCVGRRWRNTPAYQAGAPVASFQHTALLRYVAP